MPRVFADTSYWFALLNQRDELHDAAVRLSRMHSGDEIVTSDLVLVELLNGCSRSAGLREVASALAAGLFARQGAVVCCAAGPLFSLAFRKYRTTPDKGWSFTDCASFEVMRREQIRVALTYDRHFEQAGFDAVLRQ